MIIRFPGFAPKPDAAVESAPQRGSRCRACRYKGSPKAAFCRRCGAPIGKGLPTRVAPAGRQADPGAAPGTGALLRWERLPRPSATSLRWNVPDLQHRAQLPVLAAEFSARTTFTRAQVTILGVLAATLGLAALVNLVGASVLVIGLITSLYVGAFAYRIRTFARSLHRDPSIVISDTEARRLWNRSLPTYTVLVPAFREPEVIARLIGELDRLEYPRDRLNIKLLLEEDDEE